MHFSGNSFSMKILTKFTGIFEEKFALDINWCLPVWGIFRVSLLDSFIEEAGWSKCPKSLRHSQAIRFYWGRCIFICCLYIEYTLLTGNNAMLTGNYFIHTAVHQTSTKMETITSERGGSYPEQTGSTESRELSLIQWLLSNLAGSEVLTIKMSSIQVKCYNLLCSFSF